MIHSQELRRNRGVGNAGQAVLGLKGLIVCLPERGLVLGCLVRAWQGRAGHPCAGHPHTRPRPERGLPSQPITWHPASLVTNLCPSRRGEQEGRRGPTAGSWGCLSLGLSLSGHPWAGPLVLCPVSRQSPSGAAMRLSEVLPAWLSGRDL